MIKLFQKLIKNQSYVTAVDIGSKQIKVLEMKISQGQVEIDYIANIPSPTMRDGQFNEEELARIMIELIKQSGVKERDIVTSISNSRMIIRQLKVPVVSNSELSQILQAETQKQIPLSLNDFIVRYVMLGQEENNCVIQNNWLVAAVPKNLVEQIYHIFIMAGLRVRSIDLQAFALWRLFAQERQSRVTAILEIGANFSQLIIVLNGEIKFLRVISIGGGRIFTPKIETGNNVIEEMEYLIREINRSLDFYRSQMEGLVVEEIILTGGTANITGIDSLLTERLGILATIKAPTSTLLRLNSNFEYDPSYAVALGLALGEVERF